MLHTAIMEEGTSERYISNGVSSCWGRQESPARLFSATVINQDAQRFLFPLSLSLSLSLSLFQIFSRHSLPVSLLSLMLSPSSPLCRLVLYQRELVSYPVNNLLMVSGRLIIGPVAEEPGDKDKPLPPRRERQTTSEEHREREGGREAEEELREGGGD